MPIAIVSVPVTDVSRARDFYVREMAFNLLRDEPMGPDMRWVQLQPEDGGATIALVTWLEGLKPGGLQGLLVGVADVDAAYARLTGHGVECSAIEEQPWGRYTMLKDPDGNGWIVTQLTDPDEVRSH